MTEGIVEKIKSKLKCSICLRLLDDARVLKCGHMFCFTCIKQDYERLGLNKGNCPVCREAYFLKERDTQYLAKAFQVNAVLEEVKLAKYLCAFCQSGDGSMVCLKCNLTICNNCSKRTMLNCQHQTVTMAYLDTDPFLKAIVQRSRAKQTCSSHSDENVSFFCLNCKRVMCNACYNEAHRHHEVIELRGYVTRLRDKNIPGMLESKKLELDQALQKLGVHASSLERLRRPDRMPHDKGIQQLLSKRDEVSDIHKQLWYLFMYGSDKAIVELFSEKEADVKKLLDRSPTNVSTATRNMKDLLTNMQHSPISYKKQEPNMFNSLFDKDWKG